MNKITQLLAGLSASQQSRVWGAWKKIEAAKQKKAWVLDLRSMALTSEDLELVLPFIQEIPGLVELDLGRNRLTTLPPRLFSLTRLKRLFLNNNGITVIPDKLGNLKELEKLNLNCNAFASVPDGIAHLERLELLDIANNDNLHTLPDAIFRLKSKVYISLDLDQMPETTIARLIHRFLSVASQKNRILETAKYPILSGLSEFRRANIHAALIRIEEAAHTNAEALILRKMDLTSQDLTLLMPDIRKIQNLKTLDLGENKLTVMSDRLFDWDSNVWFRLRKTISSLSSLEALYLDHNELQEVPVLIGDLSALHTLELSYNRLSAFRANMGRLKKLKRLGLSHNQLVKIPKSIGALNKLDLLDLRENPQLVDLPDTLKRLPPRLDLRCDVKGLSNATFMSMGFYFDAFKARRAIWSQQPTLAGLGAPRQSRVGAAIAKINEAKEAHSTTLDLSAMQLSSEDLRILLPFLREFPGLTQLDLSRNRLDILPVALTRLTALKELRLDDNRIRKIPNRIDKLSQLKVLSLSKNKLRFIPKEIENLQQLRILKWSDNNLSEIHANLGRLTKLKQLGFRNNKLEKIPEEVGALGALKILDVRGNPNLRSLPNSMIGLSPELDLRGDWEGLSEETIVALGFHFKALAPGVVAWSKHPKPGGLAKSRLARIRTALAKIRQVQENGGRSLDLSGLGINSEDLGLLLPSVQEIAGLEELDLSQNRIAILPKMLFELSNLKSLSVGNNKLTAIPEEIESLARLGMLNIKNNNALVRLPYSMINFPKSLDLSANLEVFSEATFMALGFHFDAFATRRTEWAQSSMLPGLSWSRKDKIKAALKKIQKAKETSATHLDLSAMELDTEDLGMLLPFVREIGGLEILNLSHNNIAILPESITHFSSLKRLYLENNKLAKVPDTIAALTSLEELYLDHNELVAIPSSIGALERLRKLCLENNKLSKVPETIAALTSLRVLRLGQNQITEIPEGIGDLERLRKLYLENNKLVTLPDTIGALASLSALYLDHNQLREIPVSMGALTSLKELDISDNMLREIPETIGDLTLLEVLGLGNNRDLRGLPNSITHLESSLDISLDLEQLSSASMDLLAQHFKVLASQRFRISQIAKYPQLAGFKESEQSMVVVALTRVEAAIQNNTSELDLKDLQLTSEDLALLMPDIQKITGLRKLNLQKNRLVSLPETFANLSSLKQLYLADNQLTTIPKSIGSLTALEVLSLGRNKLTQLSSTLAPLVQLQKLDLGDNNLAQISDSIGELTALVFLNLRNNRELHILPDAMMRLSPGLQFQVDFGELSDRTLMALGFHFDAFVASMSNWVDQKKFPGISWERQLRVMSVFKDIVAAKRINATELDLSERELISEDLEILIPYIQKISGLKKLNLSKNNLTGMPSQISVLTALEELRLSKNKIGKIPDEMGALAFLKKLYLGNNNLVALSDRIGNLTALEILNISDNPKLRILPKTMKALSPGLRLIGDLQELSDETFMNLGFHFDAFAARRAEWASNPILLYQMGSRQFAMKAALVKIKLAGQNDTKYLDLSGMGLTSAELEILLPFVLQEIPGLERLDLSRNSLVTLPTKLMDLSALNILLLSQNALTAVSPDIGALTALRRLDLSSNALGALPETMTNLPSALDIRLDTAQMLADTLRMLIGHFRADEDKSAAWARYLAVGELPRSQQSRVKRGLTKIEVAKSLGASTLDFRDMGLIYRDLEILLTFIVQALPDLEGLDLSQNSLTTLPESLADLSGLNELYLDQNTLATLPDTFSALTQLRRLGLRANRLSALPKGIGALQSLESLDISRNADLGALPVTVTNWPATLDISLDVDTLTTDTLRMIIGHFDGNPLRNAAWSKHLLLAELSDPEESRIRQALDKIEAANKTNSTTLDLSNMELTSGDFEMLLPFVQQAIPNLERLNLSRNNLIALPEILVELSSLSALHLDHNALKTIPNNIGALTNLETLDLRDNADLHTLPDTMTNLLLDVDIKLDISQMSLDTLRMLTRHFGANESRRAAWIKHLLSAELLEPQKSRIIEAFHKIEAAHKTDPKTLDLSNMGLTSQDLDLLLPFMVHELADLQRLDLSQNSLVTLPEALADLSSLKVLDLHQNALTTLPSGIGALTNLETLDLRDNTDLRTLPIAMRHLSSDLDLRGNLEELSNQTFGDLSFHFEVFAARRAAWATDPELPGLPPSSRPKIRAALSKIAAFKGINDDAIIELAATAPFPGALDLSGMGLTANELSVLMPFIQEIPSLRALDLRNNELDTVPKTIAKLSSLQGLHLGGNYLEFLPAHLFELTNLQILHLGQNRLTEIPERIAKLTNLRFLYLGINQLTTLPEGIGALTKIKFLYLGGNGLSAIPESIGALTDLEQMIIAGNPDLHDLPKTMINLSPACYILGDLDRLSEATFMALGFHFDVFKERRGEWSENPDLPGLSEQERPGVWAALNEMRSKYYSEDKRLFFNELGLTSNSLRLLIPFLQQMDNKKVLDLSGNNLTTLPETICTLSWLRGLYLDNNQSISAIPEGIGDLTNLEVLGLTGIPTSGILPKSIIRLSPDLDLRVDPEQLSDQEVLMLAFHFTLLLDKRMEWSLDRNRPGLSESQRSRVLKALKLTESARRWRSSSLRLDGMELTSEDLKIIFYFIRGLGDLDLLDLSNNRIDFLPKSIGELTFLKTLILSRNGLKEVPDTIGNLVHLEVLNLAKNALVSVPDGIQKLGRLEMFNLSSNQLTELPAQIGALENLSFLDITNNSKLRHLPHSITALSPTLNFQHDFDALDDRAYFVPGFYFNAFAAQREVWRNHPELPGLSEAQQSRVRAALAKIEAERQKNPMVLDLSGMRLTSEDLRLIIPFIRYSTNGIQNLEHLDLSDNFLESIPDNIVRLRYLKSLILSGNRITVFPAHMKHFTKLKHLDLSNNALEEISENIGALINLEILDLSRNDFDKLPGNVGKLLNLKVLDLEVNRVMKVLPSSLRALSPTLDLRANLNGMTEKTFMALGFYFDAFADRREAWSVHPDLPGLSDQDQKSRIRTALDKIAHAKHQLPVREEQEGNPEPRFIKMLDLTEMELSSEDMRLLQPFIHEIEGLEFLNLSRNQLTTFPEDVTNLRALKRLNLRNNEIVEIPESIGRLILLEELDLSFNRLGPDVQRAKPKPEISGSASTGAIQIIGGDAERAVSLLPKSESLGPKLQDTQQTAKRIKSKRYGPQPRHKSEPLPENLGRLRRLKKLFLHRNELETIPKAIEMLGELETLDLSSNRITKMGLSIGWLKKLKILNVGINEITILPENIGDLRALEELYLNNNRFKEIPESIGNLSGLKILSIWENPGLLDPKAETITLPMTMKSLSPALDLRGDWHLLSKKSFLHLGFYFVSLAARRAAWAQEEKLAFLSYEQRDRIRPALDRIDYSKENYATDLDLSKLELTSKDMELLMLFIQEIEGLKSLDLSENKIRVIPYNVEGLSKLRVLDLNNNPISYLPTSITQLSSSLDLRGDWKGLSEGTLSALEKHFSGFSRTLVPQTLSEEDSDHLRIAAELKIIRALDEIEIAKECNAKTLDFYGMELTSADLETLFPAILEMHTLERLNLGGNALTFLPKTIAELTTLEFLDLRDNEEMRILPDSMTTLSPSMGIQVDLEPLSEASLRLVLDHFEDYAIPRLKEAENQLLSKLTESQYTRVSAVFDKFEETLKTGATTLDLHDMALTSEDLALLMPFFQLIPDLETLDLSSNRLDHLPETMAKLTSLRKLHLGDNQLAQIPEDSLTAMTHLEKLVLSRNPLTSFPEQICHLTQLSELYLSGCGLREIPEAIQNLQGLNKLYLDDNALAAFPMGVLKLTALRKLDLGSNQFTAIPETLRNLKQLEKLGLKANELHVFPELVLELKQLKELDLGDNKLGEIPNELKELQQLEKLNLQANELPVFPAVILDLRQLKQLYLDGNEFTEIPKDIGHLQQLEVLGLGNNALAAIPEGIGTLQRLKELGLGGNRLASLPDRIGDLIGLQFLEVTDNPELRSLPYTLKALSKGLELEIDLDQLSAGESKRLVDHFEIFVPKRMYDLIAQVPLAQSRRHQSKMENAFRKIEEAVETHSNLLDLGDMQLTSMDLEILIPFIQNIKDLETLDLSNNELTTLPPDISNLTTLKKLDLGRNQLLDIPDSIGALRGLETLDLRHNLSLKEWPPAMMLLSPKLDIRVDLDALRPKVLDMAFFHFQNMALHNKRNIRQKIGSLRMMSRRLGLQSALEKIDRAKQTKAKHLDLTGMNLENKDLELLVPYIQHLTHLETLDLANNALTRLPANIAALTALKQLDLSQNDISEIPDDIGVLNNLEVLDLHQNPSLHKLPNGMTHLSPKLQIRGDMDLMAMETSPVLMNHFEVFALQSFQTMADQLWSAQSGPQQSRIAKALIPIKEALQTHNNTLALQGMSLTSADLEVLMPFILKIPNLQTLDLSNNRLATVSHSISDLQELEVFHLGQNALTQLPESIGDLAALQVLGLENNPELTVLPNTMIHLSRALEVRADLKGCSKPAFKMLRDHFGANAAQRLPEDQSQLLSELSGSQKSRISAALIEIDKTKRSYDEVLDLSHMRLTEADLKMLIPYIIDIPELRRLNLSANNLAALPDEIGALEDIEGLNLTDNPNLQRLPKAMISFSTSLEIQGDLELWSRNSSHRLRDYFDVFVGPRLQKVLDHGWDRNSRSRKIRIQEALGRIAQMKQTKSSILDLSNLKLTSNDIALLQPHIRNIEGLKTLDLSENDLDSLPETIGLLPPELNVYLDVEKLSEDTMTMLGRHFDVFESLKHAWARHEMPLGLSKEGQARMRRALIRIELAKNQCKTDVALDNLQLTSDDLELLYPHIEGIQGLQYLDLSHNKLTTLPDNIGHIFSLKALDLGHNALSHIPERIGELRRLKMLNLKDNENLKVLPKTMTKLSPSLDLRADLNAFEDQTFMALGFHLNAFQDRRAAWIRNPEFPGLESSRMARIGAALTKIEEAKNIPLSALDLSDMELTTEDMYLLMAYIQKIEGLVSLNLSGNALHSLPKNIGNLSALQDLDLARNNLREIPKSIGRLTGLKVLHLNANALGTIPASIGSLKQLEKLNLSANVLKTIPYTIGDLEQLKTLQLSANVLKEIPQTIGRLENLKALHVNHNKLKEIPDKVGDLIALEVLDLSDNTALQVLPRTMTQLSAKLDLQIASDQLAGLTKEMLEGHFERLITKKLYSESKRLQRRPSASEKSRVRTILGKITEARRGDTTVLDLSNLELTSKDLKVLIPYIQDLTHIKTLDLSHNALTTVPETLFGSVAMENLDLSNNNLTQIPNRVSNLGQLRELHLRSNRLQKMPSSIGALSRLEVLDLSDNELLRELPKTMTGLSPGVDLRVDTDRLSARTSTLLLTHFLPVAKRVRSRAQQLEPKKPDIPHPMAAMAKLAGGLASKSNAKSQHNAIPDLGALCSLSDRNRKRNASRERLR